MAAGLSRAQKTSRAYNHLQAIRRELLKAGVSTQYNPATERTNAHLVFFEGDGITFPKAKVDGGFNISIGWSSASNGETFGEVRIYLVLRGETKRYAGWGYNCDGAFSTGLEIVKAEFKGVRLGSEFKGAL